jgi:hypothetical protein
MTPPVVSSAEPITEQIPVLPALAAPWGIDPRTPLMPVAVGGVALAGASIVLAGAWAGLVRFVGPLVGFGLPGATAWRWDLANATLGGIPGAVAVAAGLVMLLAVRRVRIGGGRAPVVLAGIMATLVGLWLVFGSWVLPLASGVRGDFSHVTRWSELGRLAGYALGPGVVLLACGIAGAVLGNQHRTVRLAAVRARRPARPGGR